MENSMNSVSIKGWRRPNPHRYPYEKGEPHSVKEKFKATKCFDQLGFVGDKWCCSPVIETSEGLILIDAMEPDQEHLDLILEGIKDLGHNPSEVKAVLITHGHVDHWGKADYFRDQFGAKIYMSADDFAYAKSPNTRSPVGPMPFDVDGFIEGGDIFTLGDVSIKIYSTPGHTVGGISFIIPVTDDGVPHKMALWGGLGVPRTHEERVTYLKSCDYFMDVCREEGVDGEIVNHTFVDMTAERLEICRNIIDGVANPFVIGTDATVRFLQELKNNCLEVLEAEK